jgi:hypothetical protein
MPEITLSLAEYDELKRRVASLEDELRTARADLEAVRLGGAGGDAAKLATALQDAFAVVQFAVASCPPRMTPGWPHQALLELAEALPDLPGLPGFITEIWVDLRMFARDAKEWEDARANGTAELKFLEENASGLSIPDELLDPGSPGRSDPDES